MILVIVPAAPTRNELRTLLVHEVVRDWPETLSIFERAGISVASEGAEPFSSLTASDETILTRVLEATSWRATTDDERPSREGPAASVS